MFFRVFSRVTVLHFSTVGENTEEARIQLQRIASWIMDLKGDRSLRKLAADCGLTVSSVQRAASGKDNVEAATVLQILSKCGVQPNMKEFAHGRADDLLLLEHFQTLLDYRPHRKTVVAFIENLYSSVPKPTQKRAS